MKKILIALLLLITTSAAFATETVWYYIYIQTDYAQGPWKRESLFTAEHNNYLEARPFMDALGSEAIDMVTVMFNHIKKEDPERYTFKAILDVVGDTVIIKTPDTINDFDAVKNELVATYTLNSFAAVKILQKNKAAIYKLEDISVPYMDLVMPKQEKH